MFKKRTDMVQSQRLRGSGRISTAQRRVNEYIYYFIFLNDVSSAGTFSRHGRDETLAYDCKLGREGTHKLLLNDKLNLISPKVTNPPAEKRPF